MKFRPLYIDYHVDAVSRLAEAPCVPKPRILLDPTEVEYDDTDEESCDGIVAAKKAAVSSRAFDDDASFDFLNTNHLQDTGEDDESSVPIAARAGRESKSSETKTPAPRAKGVASTTRGLPEDILQNDPLQDTDDESLAELFDTDSTDGETPPKPKRSTHLPSLNIVVEHRAAGMNHLPSSTRKKKSRFFSDIFGDDDSFDVPHTNQELDSDDDDDEKSCTPLANAGQASQSSKAGASKPFEVVLPHEALEAHPLEDTDEEYSITSLQASTKDAAREEFEHGKSSDLVCDKKDDTNKDQPPCPEYEDALVEPGKQLPPSESHSIQDSSTIEAPLSSAKSISPPSSSHASNHLVEPVVFPKKRKRVLPQKLPTETKRAKALDLSVLDARLRSLHGSSNKARAVFWKYRPLLLFGTSILNQNVYFQFMRCPKMDFVYLELLNLSRNGVLEGLVTYRTFKPSEEDVDRITKLCVGGGFVVHTAEETNCPMPDTSSGLLPSAQEPLDIPVVWRNIIKAGMAMLQNPDNANFFASYGIVTHAPPNDENQRAIVVKRKRQLTFDVPDAKRDEPHLDIKNPICFPTIEQHAPKQGDKTDSQLREKKKKKKSKLDKARKTSKKEKSPRVDVAESAKKERSQSPTLKSSIVEIERQTPKLVAPSDNVPVTSNSVLVASHRQPDPVGLSSGVPDKAHMPPLRQSVSEPVGLATRSATRGAPKLPRAKMSRPSTGLVPLSSKRPQTALRPISSSKYNTGRIRQFVEVKEAANTAVLDTKKEKKRKKESKKKRKEKRRKKLGNTTDPHTEGSATIQAKANVSSTPANGPIYDRKRPVPIPPANVNRTAKKRPTLQHQLNPDASTRTETQHQQQFPRFDMPPVDSWSSQRPRDCAENTRVSTYRQSAVPILSQNAAPGSTHIPTNDHGVVSAAMQVENMPTGRSDGLPARKALCSERFLEAFGETVALLAMGRWVSPSVAEVAGNQTSATENPLGRKVQLLDTPLVDNVGVDIEIPGKQAIIVKGSILFESPHDTRAFTVELLELITFGRYDRVLVIVYTGETATKSFLAAYNQLQIALLRQNGSPRCEVSFQLVTLRSLPSAIALRVLSSPRIEQNALESVIDDCSAESRAQERARFLLSVVPSLSVYGAMQCLAFVPPTKNVLQVFLGNNRRMVERSFQNRPDMLSEVGLRTLKHIFEAGDVALSNLEN